MSNSQNILYANISLNKQVNVPYWCNTLSAYNDAPATGYLALTSYLFTQPLPINAKYSLRLMQNDLQNNEAKPLDYYGTVVHIGGKIIKYDPAVMTGQITSNTPNPGTSLPPPGTQNTGNNGDLLSAAKDVASQHPIAVSAGLLLILFGIGSVLSSK